MRTGAAVLFVLAVALSDGRAGDWPQWRGENRDGVWRQDGLPEKLPATGLKPRWRQSIGGGYSGIAVSGGRVYTLDYYKKPREVERVLCFDARTGKPLWSHSYPVAYGKMDYGNGPRSTPTIHKGKVYTFGARGHLFCLDPVGGKVIWARDTVKDFAGRVPQWGHSCSPLVDGPRLMVQVGGKKGAGLVALNLDTGKEIWRSLDDRPGYSSPTVIGGKGWRQIAYWTPEHVVGLDPDSGKLLWKVPFPITYDVSITDLVWHDGVLLASNYWTGSKAIRFDARGANPKVIWQGRRLSMLMSTPLWRAGHIYALDRKDGLKCIELLSGKVKWGGEHVTPRGHNPQATLVWAGERALIFNERGELILAQLTPEKYEEISRIKLIEKDTWAHPAYADGCIFVRTDEDLLCIPLAVR